jgi:hypothetical protein
MKNILYACMFLAICGIITLSSCGQEPENTAPAAPVNLTVSDFTETSATLTWEGATTSYEIVIGDAEALPVTGKTHTAEGLTAGAEYTWKVRAVEGGLAGEWADGPVFTTTPGAPTNLAVSNRTETSATFTWEGTTFGYEIVIGEAEPMIVNAKTYTTEGLTASTEYTWKVRSVVGDNIAGEWTDGPAFTTTPVAPKTLRVADLTETSATFTWEGTAASYEIVVGEAEAMIVNAKTYTAEGLTASTRYTWKVRAVIGDNTAGEWVDGPAFTTWAEPIEVEFLYNISNGYSAHPGKGQMVILFTTFDPQSPNKTGWFVQLAFVTPPIEEIPRMQYLDIPAGTYDSSYSGQPNTLYTTETKLMEVAADGNFVEPMPTVVSGTMTISGDHTNSSVTMRLFLDDGRHIMATYNGEILLKNPSHIPALYTEFTRADVKGKTFYGSMNYFVRMYDDGEATGNRFLFTMDLYAPGSSTSVITDGTYTFTKGIDDFEIFTGGLSQYLEDGHMGNYDNIKSGTVTITNTGGDTYTIVTNFELDSGVKFEKSYSGTVTPR